MRKLLESYKENKDIVSIHSDREDMSGASVGYLVHVGDEWLALSSIDPYGCEMGFEIRKIAEVFRVEEGGEYEKAILKLSKSASNKKIDIIDFDFSNLINILRSAQRNDFIVSLWLDGDDDQISGSIGEIDNNLLKLNVIDDFGKPDGFMLLKLEDLAALDVGTKFEDKLQRLQNATIYTNGI